MKGNWFCGGGGGGLQHCVNICMAVKNMISVANTGKQGMIVNHFINTAQILFVRASF